MLACSFPNQIKPEMLCIWFITSFFVHKILHQKNTDLNKSLIRNIFGHLAQVIGVVDIATHWTNRHPIESAVCLANMLST